MALSDTRLPVSDGVHRGTGILPVRAASDAGVHRGTGILPVQGDCGFVEYPDVIAQTSKGFFSRLSETDVHLRNLPHWGQENTLVFVTFRLADSLPADVVRQWQEERDEWVKAHPQPWDEAVMQEYARLFPYKMEKWLDRGSGSCVLRRTDCRQAVMEALEYFNAGDDLGGANGQDARSPMNASPALNGQDARSPKMRASRYRLHSYVVMPNHVHVLMELFHREDLPKILHSWKSYTAKSINALTGGTGTVWQSEYFDRLVRNARHYRNTLMYIRQNWELIKGQSR